MRTIWGALEGLLSLSGGITVPPVVAERWLRRRSRTRVRHLDWVAAGCEVGGAGLLSGRASLSGQSDRSPKAGVLHGLPGGQVASACLDLQPAVHSGRVLRRPGTFAMRTLSSSHIHKKMSQT